MNINDLIDYIDDVTFVDKKNPYNISMIYFSNISESYIETKKIALNCDIMDYTDWRLPTINELEYINKISFRRFRSGWYWSSDESKNFAKIIHFSSLDNTTTYIENEDRNDKHHWFILIR